MIQSNYFKPFLNLGNDAVLNFNLRDYDDINAVKAAISAIEYRGGNTNTTGALRLVRQQVSNMLRARLLTCHGYTTKQVFNGADGDRSYAPNILLLVTDGATTREVEDLIPEAERLKEEGVFIIAFGVTPAVSVCLKLQGNLCPVI